MLWLVFIVWAIGALLALAITVRLFRLMANTRPRKAQLRELARDDQRRLPDRERQRDSHIPFM